jgi:hypothetical protein
MGNRSNSIRARVSGVGVRLRWARSAALALALALPALAATTIHVLCELMPEISKKPEAGYSVSGAVYKFENKDLKCEVEYLTPEARRQYFSKRGFEDPLRGLASEEDFFVVRARFENLLKEGDLVMSPNTVLFENCQVKEETALYSMFYLRPDGEKRLQAAGAVFYLKSLSLPPGLWIERLYLFQYEDPYQTKHMKLVIASILTGDRQWDLEFPFLAKYKKEKV